MAKCNEMAWLVLSWLYNGVSDLAVPVFMRWLSNYRSKGPLKCHLIETFMWKFTGSYVIHRRKRELNSLTNTVVWHHPRDYRPIWQRKDESRASVRNEDISLSSWQDFYINDSINSYTGWTQWPQAPLEFVFRYVSHLLVILSTS